MKTFFSFLSVTVAPGKIQRHAITGRSLYIHSANLPFFLELDRSGEVPVTSGLGLSAWEGEMFREVVIRNPDASKTLTAALYFGMGNYLSTNDSITVKEAPTVAVTNAATSLAAGDNILLNGISTDTRAGSRKAVLIFNEDAVESLYLYAPTAGDSRCGIVYPRTSVIVETSDSLAVKNPSGVTVSLAIMETFYQKLPGT